jgi:hypothetical protein
MKDKQGKPLSVKDNVRFSTKFGEVVGVVQHISNNFAKVCLQVPEFGVYTWSKSSKELEKMQDWVRV